MVLLVRDKDQTVRGLYAQRWILIKYSEYFASRLKTPYPFQILSVVGLQQCWNNGHKKTKTSGGQLPLSSTLPPALKSTETLSEEKAAPPTSEGQDTIRMDDIEDDIDYVTLHNILYYIYTGCVNLILGKAHGTKHAIAPEGFPERPDPFDLYRNAERLLLFPLRDHSFKYLRATTTTANVAERLFHRDCEVHDALREFFLDFFMERYDDVIRTDGWEAIVMNKNNEANGLRRYHKRMILDISRRVKPI